MGDESGSTGLRRRAVAAVVLVVVGSLSLTVALVAGWAERTVFDNGEFATRAVSVLDSATVRHALAEDITNQVVENGSSSLASYRAELVGVIDDILTTDGFRAIFRSAIKQAHRAVFERDGAAAVLELGETLQLLSEHAAATSSSLASKLPSATGSLLIDITPTVRQLDLWKFANDIRWLDEVALALSALCFAGAILLDRRRDVFIRLGVGVATAGVVVVVLAEIIPDVAVGVINDHAEAGAISAGIRQFVVDLQALGLWTIPFGVILAAAAEASERADQLRVRAWLVRLRSRRFGELGHAAQLGVGVGVVAAGVLVLVLRHQIVALTVLVGGFAAIYVGTVLVIRALLGPAPEEAAAPRTRLSRRLLVVSSAIVVLVLLTGALITNVATASGQARARGVLRCNGSEGLCNRRLDEVAFAGSHNSMSAESDTGWLFAENLHGIPAQLEYGIRALLVKTHYGIATGINIAGTPLVVTDKAAEISYDKSNEADELGAEAVAAVERISRTVGEVKGRPEIYLCHGYCELGATKLSDTLVAIRQFMNRNPDDVLIMIIGDFVTPEDTAQAFQQAGLVDRVWTYGIDDQPPTLRQMIDARRTLMVLAEHEGGSPGWYGSAYLGAGVFQDTPYTFAEPGAFSCAPNRGPADAPLFQINHWITNTSPPSAKQARSINSYATLMDRVETCERERQRFPTIVGVNFYDQGDLLGVVDRLNRRGALPAEDLGPTTTSR